MSLTQHWKTANNSLVREFTFTDFKKALAFINAVGKIAEEQEHHPEITNVYNRVTLRLRTHDAGDIVTEKDIALAKAIDAIRNHAA